MHAFVAIYNRLRLVVNKCLLFGAKKVEINDGVYNTISLDLIIVLRSVKKTFTF